MLREHRCGEKKHFYGMGNCIAAMLLLEPNYTNHLNIIHIVQYNHSTFPKSITFLRSHSHTVCHPVVWQQAMGHLESHPPILWAEM